MLAETLLAGMFAADTGIVAIVATNMGVASRLPQNGASAPALSWQRISTVPTSDLTSGGDLDDVRMQIDSWGQTPEQAATLANLVRDLLDPAADVGAGRFDSWEGPTLDSETRVWRVRCDYFIWQERN